MWVVRTQVSAEDLVERATRRPSLGFELEPMWESE
jgi:hypothetical protein